jgi:hypothetical protein
MASEQQQHAVKPIEEVLPSAQLLAHYRHRIGARAQKSARNNALHCSRSSGIDRYQPCTTIADEFEAEREELLRAVARCAVQADELHRTEWEARKRADEVRELQQALSDAQQFLFEERQRLLSLQAENDELKLQELDDRKRMQQLLSMAAPLDQTVLYRPDGLPIATTLPPGGGGCSGGNPSSSGGGGAAGQHRQQQRGGAAGGGAVRTVFLPAANADALVLKIEALQAQLNEQVRRWGWGERVGGAVVVPTCSPGLVECTLPPCPTPCPTTTTTPHQPTAPNHLPNSTSAPCPRSASRRCWSTAASARRRTAATVPRSCCRSSPSRPRSRSSRGRCVARRRIT